MRRQLRPWARAARTASRNAASARRTAAAALATDRKGVAPRRIDRGRVERVETRVLVDLIVHNVDVMPHVPRPSQRLDRGFPCGDTAAGGRLHVGPCWVPQSPQYPVKEARPHFPGEASTSRRRPYLRLCSGTARVGIHAPQGETTPSPPTQGNETYHPAVTGQLQLASPFAQQGVENRQLTIACW